MYGYNVCAFLCMMMVDDDDNDGPYIYIYILGSGRVKEAGWNCCAHYCHEPCGLCSSHGVGAMLRLARWP